MAFDKEYPNRKDHRRPYRGAKAVDRTCRNHGSCPYCAEGREHPDKRRVPADAEDDIRSAVGRSFEEFLTCVYCGKSDDTVFRSPDPYDSDVNNDDTEVSIYDVCYEERAADI